MAAGLFGPALLLVERANNSFGSVVNAVTRATAGLRYVALHLAGLAYRAVTPTSLSPT
jgi:hypothetical protein